MIEPNQLIIDFFEKRRDCNLEDTKNEQKNNTKRHMAILHFRQEEPFM